MADDLVSIRGLSLTEKAYLAGILDGEGSIGVYKRFVGKKKGASYSLRVMVGNTDVSLIRWLQRLGGSIYEQKPKKSNWSVCYTWTVWANQAAAILEEVLPYMLVKREQAERALFFQSRKSHTGRPLDKIDVFLSELAVEKINTYGGKENDR
jgi:hypothetical protein